MTAMTDKQQQAVEDFNKLPAWDAPRLVSVDNLEFTDWNVNEMNDAEFSELVAEIEETGFDEPLGVMPIPGVPDRYLVPSGEHRARAAIALEMETVPCVLKIHLTEVDEAEVKMWTVKRNNVRGRLNAQKYADLERGLSEKHQIRAKAARERMLVKGDLLKQLRKNAAIIENEDGGGSESRGGEGEGTDGDPPQAPTDSVGAKKTLLAALKAAEEEVLLQSADTVEHGYLFFIQGDGGGTHLVVDESNTLHDKINEMVDYCKRDKAEVDAFLVGAIEHALEAKKVV
jgi:hypothetical protein